jgi:hypothetical protein
MKKIILTSFLAVLVALGTTVRAQEYPDEYLGLPGDNLNLYAVMKLFQESETLEAFERSLNDENTRINNLDLNGDKFVDYITVNDYVDGDVHTIVLRVAPDRNEFQDVAVFTVQKFRNGSVQIQLIGDEALYGQNYIVEPNYAETPNPGYMGKPNKRVIVNVVYTSYWEVAEWPLVRFIYMPGYHIWNSSWYWGYYPPYWHPWHSCYWHYYYGYHYNWYHHYYRHYRHWHHPRWDGYHTFYYTEHHYHSTIVYEHINKGTYNTTYSRPEQRREGEALFTSMYPDRERRTEQNTPVVSQRRSSSSQMTRTETSTRITSATTRRPENVPTVRSASDPSTRPGTGSTRRPAVTMDERPVTKSSSGESSDASRRPSTNVNERPAVKSAPDDEPAPVRRTTVTEREVSRPEPSKSETEYRRQPEPVQERVVSRPEPSKSKTEYRRQPEPVQERVVSQPEPARREEAPRASRPAPSQPERKPAAESKSEPAERRSEKPQRPDENENPRR